MATDWLDLPTLPALPGLFLRAALRRGASGRTLPDLGLRTQVEVDARHLARYRQVCGFGDNGRLPATYPHILAFPLQMQLLTDKRFPFPLLGLVHLENRIRVLRTLGGLGPFRVSVAVQDLRPHDKGATFSLITRLEDQLGLLWEGDSRILYRGLRLDGAPAPREEVEALPLTELDHWRAAKDIGRRYARVAGDYNPIHLSAPSAKLFGFPAPSPTACGTRRAPWPPSAPTCRMPATKWRCASRSPSCCPPRFACWSAPPAPAASSPCAARTTCRTWPAAGHRWPTSTSAAPARRLHPAVPGTKLCGLPGEPHEPRRHYPPPARHS